MDKGMNIKCRKRDKPSAAGAQKQELTLFLGSTRASWEVKLRLVVKSV